MTIVRLLHGLGADRRAFQRFERLLPGEWNIASIDLLGHGDAPHPEHGYSLDDHAAWIASQVEADAPVVLVGHSYGAAVAVATAALYPALVASIVLLDPVARLEGVNEVGSKSRMMMDARRAGTLEATVPVVFPNESAVLQRWTIDTWQRMALGVIDEFDPLWTRFADRVTCPVAIVHGELGLGGSGDLAADWFDDPLVTRIAGAGHYLHATHARETVAAIVTALATFQ